MCGNRLKLWNTMPTSRRSAVQVDALAGHHVAIEPDLAAFDRLQPVDAAQQRRLAAAGGPDEAHDLVLVHAQVDAAQDRGVPVGLGHILDVEECHVSPSLPSRCSSRSSSRSTNRVCGMVTMMNSAATTVTAERLK